MENKVKKLFEYQIFEKSANLQALIEETHSRYGDALSDEELGGVAAAGELRESLSEHIKAVNLASESKEYDHNAFGSCEKRNGRE